MWVNKFARFDLSSQQNPPQAGANWGVDPIFCNGTWLPADHLFTEEKDFLDYVTDGMNNGGAEVERLVLYSITWLLNNRNETSDLPGSNAPQSVIDMTFEQHLARFIFVAKHDYELEIQVVLPSNAGNGSHNMSTYSDNNENVYDFTLLSSSYLDSYNHANDDYTGGDPCLSANAFTAGKSAGIQGGGDDLWEYFDEELHGTVFPIDGNGILHPFDESRKGIWNVRVFQHNFESILGGVRHSHLPGFPDTPFENYCAIDRVIPEIEFWQDKTDQVGQNSYGNDVYRINDAYDMLITVLDYAICASALLNDCGFEVDAWVSHFSSYSDNASPPLPPTGSDYLYYDIATNTPYDPNSSNINTILSEGIEFRVSEIYITAFHHNPCRTYYSPFSSSQRNFEYTAETFCNNNIHKDVFNPTFNTRTNNDGLYSFLVQRTPANSYNGTFGKVEVVFNNDLDGAGVVCTDGINAYSWYRREEAFDSPQFFKNSLGIGEDILNSISIYPNPATHSISISHTASESFKNQSFQIIDMKGSLVYSGIINENDMINVSPLSPGSYILKIERHTGKLIIK